MIGVHPLSDFSRLLGMEWSEYVFLFETPKGRADLADRFVKLARDHGVVVEVIYE